MSGHKSKKKGSNIICRVSNVTPEMVCRYVERLPKHKMKENAFRSIMGTGWFQNEHQAPEQWGLYYIDGADYYPRFNHDITIEEAKAYLYHWMRNLIVINPYTRFKTQNDKNLVESIVCQLEKNPNEHDLKTIFSRILDSDEPFVINEIIANALNTFSRALKVEIIDKDEERFNVSLLPNYKELLNTKCDMTKKEYFELFDSPKTAFDTNAPLQQIFYGAPGTGKSNTIKCEVDDKGLSNIRTTFHPDTDYSTFVGAYKPTSIDVPVMTMIGTKAVPVENSDGTPRMEKKIVYEFVPQAFLKAYAEAWKKQDEPFFLIIEEINRGNCAQIFGDLFQLLDRNDEGESDYPISPDEDIQKFLLTDKKYGFAELTEEQKEAIPEEIKLGQLLKLPKNLHIWATMNTSDQSLFPIDSAFKRRWDWQYMPISDGKKDWKIEVNGKRYDWWLFLVKINEKISNTTNSEDKKLGYYFCKAKNGKIDVETFVGKVIFYLWNDVFKDFAEEAGDLFQDEDGLLTFNKFYMVDTDGKTRVVEDKVELFLKNLGVEEDEVIEYMQDDEAEAMPTDRATDASNRLHVVFSDGETIRIQTGKEYVDVLKKIGLDKAYEIAKSKNPGILKCAFVTKEKEDAIENSSYLRYETIGEYHVVRGMSGDTMRPFLEKISNRYNLGLKFYRQ